MSGDGYSYDDARKRATAGGRWFSLKNHGDSGRFMVIAAEGDKDYSAAFWPRHYIVGHGYENCGRVRDQAAFCEWCDGGERQDWRVSMTVLNLDTMERQILDGFPIAWFDDLMTTFKDIEEGGGDPTVCMYKVTRKGQKGKEVRRVITNLGPAPADVQAVALVMVPFEKAEMVKGWKEAGEGGTLSVGVVVDEEELNGNGFGSEGEDV